MGDLDELKPEWERLYDEIRRRALLSQLDQWDVQSLALALIALQLTDMRGDIYDIGKGARSLADEFAPNIEGSLIGIAESVKPIDNIASSVAQAAWIASQ